MTARQKPRELRGEIIPGERGHSIAWEGDEARETRELRPQAPCDGQTLDVAVARLPQLDDRDCLTLGQHI